MNINLGGKKPHKTKSQRKIIVYREWADRFHLTTQTIIETVQKYSKEGHTYDPRDINSVFDFYDYLTKKREAKNKALK